MVWRGLFLGGMGLMACAVTAHAITLSPEKFQRTWDDINFTDRIRLMAEDYKNYDEEYDESGRCIRGCVYPGITLAESNRLSEEATQNSTEMLNQWELEHPGDTTYVYAEYDDEYDHTPNHAQNTSNSNDNNITGDITINHIENNSNNNNNSPGNWSCPSERFSKLIPRGASIPMFSPLDSEQLIMSSDYSDARKHPVDGTIKAHRAVDLRASIGTPVYATANGVVIQSGWDTKGCGEYIKIRHPASNEITMYCHLNTNSRSVRIGDHIAAGCEIAKSGNTGKSTGPHLHYAIRNSNDVGIDPVYPKNRLGRDYKFVGNTSGLHKGKNLPGRM